MIAERSPVAFIGYPKAASTTLFDYFEAHPDIQAAMVRLTPLMEKEFRASADQEPSTDDRTHLRIVVNEKIAESVVVTGDSRLWNTYRFVPGSWNTVKSCVRIDPLETAQRIKLGYRVDRVLIVLREQLAWLESAYKFFLPRLPPKQRSFAAFCATPRGMVYLEAGHFDRTIEAYQQVFGAQNVKVMRMEHLVADREGFATELCAFLGVACVPLPAERKNVGSSNRVAAVRSRYPFVDALPATVRSAGKALLTKLLAPQGSLISAREAAAIRSRYAESNARTAEILADPKLQRR